MSAIAKPFRRLFVPAGVLLGAAFVGIQFIRPPLENPPVTGDFQAPVAVKNIVQRACYDCHSNQTDLRWFDKVAPVYWQVADHVKEGRAGLNFSTWQSLPPADQKAKLWESVNQILAGAMPLSEYTLAHPEAKVSAQDVAVLKQYVASLAKNPPADTAKLNAADRQYRHWQPNKAAPAAVPVAPNGIAYLPDYKNWQAISTTERFDNGTMRVVFGNDVAVKAIRDKHINPWPNGTAFAKVAWDQLVDAQGNVRPGAFKQVEYMLKDDQKYAATKGWGWARFKTPKLVPYGKDALFTTECIHCHQPMKNNDFVFTQPIKH
jgi:hypothetical protein